MRKRIVSVGLVCGMALAVVGCSSGHGKHTSQQISRAQSRLGQIRSATEWEMAHQAFLAGDLDRAADRVERSIALNPGVIKSRVLLGRVRLEQGKLEEARDALIEAELLDPTAVEPHYYMALLHERLSQKEEALERYLKAVELGPGDAQYAIAAAEMMVDLGRVSEAREFLEERASIFEHNSGIRQTQGHLAVMMGDYKRAAELFSEARLLAPDEPGILEDLARAQVNTDQYAEAEYNLDLLLRMSDNEDRRDLQQLRAQCLMALDRPIEAREVLISLTRDSAGSADLDTWLRLGELAYSTQDWARFRQAGQRLIAIAPDQIEGYMYRAVWLRRHDDPRAAIATLDSGLARCTETVEALVLKGLLEQEVGDFDSADATLHRVLELEPGHTQAVALINAMRRGTFSSVNPDAMDATAQP